VVVGATRAGDRTQKGGGGGWGAGWVFSSCQRSLGGGGLPSEPRWGVWGGVSQLPKEPTWVGVGGPLPPPKDFSDYDPKRTMLCLCTIKNSRRDVFGFCILTPDTKVIRPSTCM